jgi:hypothetical protein
LSDSGSPYKTITSTLSPYFGNPDEWVWQVYFDSLPVEYEHYSAYPVDVTVIAVLNSDEQMNPNWVREVPSMEISIIYKKTDSVCLRWTEAVTFSESRSEWERAL